jgi:hypothetical protein
MGNRYDRDFTHPDYKCPALVRAPLRNAKGKAPPTRSVCLSRGGELAPGAKLTDIQALPTPNSQLPTPNSQLPTPNSQLTRHIIAKTAVTTAEMG